MWFDNKPHSCTLYIPPAESASYKNKTRPHVSAIPTEGREKQSLQLVNLEIASLAHLTGQFEMPVTFLKITCLSGGLFLYAVGEVAPGVIRSVLPGSELEPEACDSRYSSEQAQRSLIVALQPGT